MSANIKKAVAKCDYCHMEKDGNQIYTGRKQFAGAKIVDILEIVTKVKIPANTPIKLCTMCTSTLHATSGTIERAGEMINKLIPLGKFTVVANKNNIQKEANEQLVQINIESDKEEEDEQEKETEVQQLNSPTKKNMASTNATSSMVKKVAKQQQLSTASPTKHDESLKHVIKLSPADEAAPNKSKAFFQLFGNSVNHISDSEESSEDDEQVTEEIKSSKKNIAINFECKMCDFTSTYPNPMKRHLKDLHGQKRPRIYNCLKCPKAFGVLKTLKLHLVTHGVVEKSTESTAAAAVEDPKIPELARFTALKPKPLLNAELTFAIQDKNSSTPKPVDAVQTFKCDICNEQHKTAKNLQKHMTVVHNIEKPKVFKCVPCDAFFMHKATLDRHTKVKHGSDQDPAKSKAPRRRKTIDERSMLAGQTVANEAGDKIKKASKIAARRKTVDASIALADLSTTIKSRKLSQVFEEINEEETPKKPNKPAAAINDSIQTLVTSPKKKSKDNNENSQLNGTVIEVAAAATPNKKTKQKKEIDSVTPLSVDTPNKSKAKKQIDSVTPLSVDTPNKSKAKKQIDSVTPLCADTPNKSKAKKVVDVLDSPGLTNGTPKNTKSKKDKDGFETPQNTPVGGTPSQVKRKKDALDTPQPPQSNNNESPKKSHKRKSQKLSESSQSSQLVIDEDAYEHNDSQVEQSPSKKSKHEASEKSLNTEIIELLDEINTNPLPHRREMLESMSQDSIVTADTALSCNQCNKVVSSRKRLDSHIRKKHTPSLNCRTCFKNFTDSNSFVAHFASCNSCNRLACGVKNCDKAFEAANFLSAHLKKKHKFH